MRIKITEEHLKALSTQYQLHGDYTISPRASKEAPTIEQLGLIREAHLNIIPIIKELLELRRGKKEA